MTSLVNFEIELKDRFGGAITATGGKFIVALTGAYVNATLYNVDTGAALSQPVALSRGRARFAIDTGVVGQTTPPGVDVFGVAPSGHGFQLYNAKPGSPNIVRIDLQNPNSMIVAPFSYASGAATEVDTGLDFKTGTFIMPLTWLDVKAVDAAITMEVGLLSSESGGDADGLLDAISVAALGPVLPQWAATSTAGALVRESQDSGASLTPRAYKVGATAVSLTWTLLTGADTALGYICCPVQVGVING